jgi:phospholipid-binding lipoprotein MlaA
MRSTTRITPLFVCLLLACGCATLPPGAQRDPRDPWERVNRTSYKINDALDRAIVKPAAKGYAKLPQPMRNGFYNFFNNFGYPVVIVNDLLQWQIKPFFSDIGRFVLNSTLGLAGFLDPASSAGLQRNDRDLGQTLGKWGIPPGPYIVVPIFGPYTVRDGLATFPDQYANPRYYLPFWWEAGFWAAQGVDTRSRLLYLDQTLQNTYDPYAFVRNAYLQHRQFMISGGEGKTEEEQEEKLMQEIGDSETTPEKPAPQPAPQGTAQPTPPQNAPAPQQTQPPSAPPPQSAPPQNSAPQTVPPTTPPPAPQATPPQQPPPSPQPQPQATPH